MLNKIKVEPVKTYKTEASLQRAVDQLPTTDGIVKYFVAWTKDGRCFPIFIGEKAIENGIHFKFNVVA